MNPSLEGRQRTPPVLPSDPISPEEVFEPLAVLPPLFHRSCDHLRVRIPPMPRSAGIDDGAAVGEILKGSALRINPRIKRRAPRVGDDVDGRGRIRPGAHRPDELLEI